MSVPKDVLVRAVAINVPFSLWMGVMYGWTWGVVMAVLGTAMTTALMALKVGQRPPWAKALLVLVPLVVVLGLALR